MARQKQCTLCGRKKSATFNNFYADKRGSMGLSPACKLCTKRRNAAYAKKNPDVIRNCLLQRRYGISAAAYDALAAAQHEACAICGTPRIDLKRGLSVDHDHSTGKVRALLCQKCNAALGLLNEDLAVAHKLVEYIQTHCISTTNG